MHTNQKRFQCERPREKKAVLREQKDALGTPVNKVDRVEGRSWLLCSDLSEQVLRPQELLCNTTASEPPWRVSALLSVKEERRYQSERVVRSLDQLSLNTL